MPAYLRFKTWGGAFFPTAVAFQRRQLSANPKACDHFKRVEHGKELVGSAHPT